MAKKTREKNQQTRQKESIKNVAIKSDKTRDKNSKKRQKGDKRHKISRKRLQKGHENRGQETFNKKRQLQKVTIKTFQKCPEKMQQKERDYKK